MLQLECGQSCATDPNQTLGLESFMEKLQLIVKYMYCVLKKKSVILGKKDKS